MTRYGFIRTKDEIKFLVLHCMSFIKIPVNFEAIIDVCTWCDGGFGYFELNEVFLELIESGHILVDDASKKKPMYRITDKGLDTAQVFEKSIPYVVRDAAESSALRVVRKIKRDEEIRTEREVKGEHNINVSLMMGEIFSINMNVVNSNQADLLEKNFFQNAEKIYNVLLESLTSSFEDEKEKCEP